MLLPATSVGGPLHWASTASVIAKSVRVPVPARLAVGFSLLFPRISSTTRMLDMAVSVHKMKINKMEYIYIYIYHI